MQKGYEKGYRDLLSMWRRVRCERVVMNRLDATEVGRRAGAETKG
jgi:hypothetical protein